MSTACTGWDGGFVVIGCRDNTAEFIDTLLLQGRVPAGVVTIGEATAAANHVPTWLDLASRFGARMPVYVAKSYGLRDAADREWLERTRTGVGFCIGWQRLLPDWFLATARNGVFGMHASQFPLPRGVGRSPINWGIIHGADTLQAHVFRYEDEPDAGSLLATVPLAVLPHDDIRTLQQKCRVIFNRTVDRYWDSLLGSGPTLLPQVGGEHLVYPKRSPADGRIDWRWTVRQVVDFVRAQSRPYPGAYLVDGQGEHRVWRCAPFGLPAEQPRRPGTVLERFEDGTFVVQAGDGAVHVLDHEIKYATAAGEELPCP